jgi:hypothetical protein
VWLNLLAINPASEIASAFAEAFSRSQFDENQAVGAVHRIGGGKQAAFEW